MNTKLTTHDQTAFLQAGDTIKRFPCNCSDGPMDKFDKSCVKHIITYRIRSINRKNGIFSLIAENSQTLTLAAPVDIGRLFIKDTDLIEEKVWWINS